MKEVKENTEKHKWFQTLKILELTLVLNKLDPDLPQKALDKGDYFEEHR